MYRLPLLILFVFCCFGQLIFAQELSIQPASTNSFWYQNKTIQLLEKQRQLQPYKISQGNNWVFQYTYKAADLPEIADDEFAETVVFELNPTSKNKIKQKISKTKHAFIYLKSCYCKDAGPIEIKKGTIKGYKLNPNTWHFELTLEIPNLTDVATPRKLKHIKGNFKLEAQ